MATEYFASVQRPKISANRIQSVRFNTASFPVQVFPGGDPANTHLKIKFWGLLNEKGARLQLHGQEVPLVDNGVFEQEINLSGQETPVELIKTNADGATEKETMTLLLRDYLFLKMGGPLANQSKFSATISGGTSLITYTQTGFPRYDQATTHIKGQMSLRLGQSQWIVGLNAFSTILPYSVSTTNPVLQQETLQFFGTNARIGYIIPSRSETWSVTLMTGIYYTTTFGTQVIGYQHYRGFQLYPTLKQTFADKSSVLIYFKFSPVTDGIPLYVPNNFEVAAGAHYQFSPQYDGSNWSLGLDFTSLTLTTPSGNVNTFSNFLSLGYTFH